MHGRCGCKLVITSQEIALLLLPDSEDEGTPARWRRSSNILTPSHLAGVREEEQSHFDPLPPGWSLGGGATCSFLIARCMGCSEINNINRHIIVSLLSLTVLKDSHNQHRLIIPHNRALENLNIHYNTAPLIMLQLLTQTWVKTAVQELRFLYA